MALDQGLDIPAILHGQTVRVPNFEKLFDEWEAHINPNEEHVKAVVDDILSTYTVSTRVNSKLTKNNLSTYVSACYPFANPEILAELTYFVCWMFLVDDEVDQITSVGGYQEVEFHGLWSEVLRIVESSCSIAGTTNGETTEGAKPVEAFQSFGKGLRQRYTVEQCSRYWNELVATASAYQVEQKYRDQGLLPDYTSYCKYRLGRCCMAQVIALVEFANQTQLPSDIMDSAEMRQLCKDTATLLWINNDIVSLKKELHDNFYENLVIISAAPTFNLQTGLDHCVQKLEEVISSINATSSVLLKKIKSRCIHDSDCQASCQQEVHQQALIFITNCKSMCRGIVTWSMQTPRYGLSELPRLEDNSLTFTVESIS